MAAVHPAPPSLGIVRRGAGTVIRRLLSALFPLRTHRLLVDHPHPPPPPPPPFKHTSAWTSHPSCPSPLFAISFTMAINPAQPMSSPAPGSPLTYRAGQIKGIYVLVGGPPRKYTFHLLPPVHNNAIQLYRSLLCAIDGMNTNTIIISASSGNSFSPAVGPCLQTDLLL